MNIHRVIAILLLGTAVGCAGNETTQAQVRLSENWQIAYTSHKKIIYSVRSLTNVAAEIAQVEFERERVGDRDYKQGFEAGIDMYLQLVRTLAHGSIDVKRESTEGDIRKGTITSQKDQLRFEARIFASQNVMLTGHLSAPQDNFAKVRPTFDQLFTKISKSPWDEWPRK